MNVGRDQIFQELWDRGIGVNIHYIPVYYHAYYRDLGYPKGLCPKAEKLFDGNAHDSVVSGNARVSCGTGDRDDRRSSGVASCADPEKLGVNELKALVTGGAGFIGRWVVKRLLEDGHEVWAMDDLSNGPLGEYRRV